MIVPRPTPRHPRERGRRRGARLAHAALGVALAGVLAGACGGGSGPATDATATSAAGGSTATADAAATSAATSTTAANTTTSPATTAKPGPAATIPPNAVPGQVAVTTPTGVLVLWQGAAPGGKGVAVRTPCERAATVPSVAALGAVDVLIDPGHGGVDPGSTTTSGLTEAKLNLEVAKAVRDRLGAKGYRVVLERESDIFYSVADRGKIAEAVKPKVFLSLHHNSGLEQPRDVGSGTEAYFRKDDPASKRLAGLLFEEVTKSLTAAFPIRWTSNSNRGARPRVDSAGADFYGVLRNSPSVPGALIEAAYMSAKAESAVVGTPAFRDAEADGIARAIERFLTTQDPGSGFKDPVVEDGKSLKPDMSRCTDPKLA